MPGAVNRGRSRSGGRARSLFIAAAALVAATMVVPVPTASAGTHRVVHQTVGDFSAGELEGTAVRYPGALELGPEAHSVGVTEELIAWAAAAGPDGALYVGTGNNGRLLSFTPGRTTPTIVHDFDELAVQALALAPDGVIYAATSPQGRVYRLDPAHRAEPQVVFEPKEETYIWDLLLGAGGNLYVATGRPGRIYEVPARGDARLLLDSGEMHILCLVAAENGDLLAGSADRGYLFRVPRDGHAFVLHDAALSDIADIAIVPKGEIAIVATGGREPPGASHGTATPSRAPAEESTPGAIPEGSLAPPAPSADATSAGALDTANRDDLSLSRAPDWSGSAGATAARYVDAAAVIRLGAAGGPELLWETHDVGFFAICPRGDGWLVGSARDGRIYRLDSSGRATVYLEAGGGQVTSLLPMPNRDVIALINSPARAVRLAPEQASHGTFRSPIIDSGVFATWGRLRHAGVGLNAETIHVRSRSGNTADPGPLWSGWEPLGEDNLVVSPEARFLQYEIELVRGGGERSPAVDRVEIAFLPLNLPPKIDRIEIMPPDVMLQTILPARVASRPTAATGSWAQAGQEDKVREVSADGYRAVQWAASDPNGDALRFAVQLRAEGESAWKTLVGDTFAKHATWDATELADGLYTIRVTASDSPSNPPAQARETSAESIPFRIDRTPPTIQNLRVSMAGREARVTFEARDEFGSLIAAGYIVDAGQWHAVYPADQVFDQTAERFRFSQPLTAGEHTITVIVEDELGNRGADSAVVRVGS
ncbi:MAG: hypothetical protein HYV63_06205 [Candidatus Schekmanbacteria bacterium]|nr:hypothetical protein [Candidatus Schekmanbacteria bacterium]